MHSIHRCLFAITLLASSAQAQVPTQARAPISPLGSIIGKAPVTFDTLINVRGLSDGRIIINDAVGHKLVTLDASFTVVTVWSDTTGNTKYNYGTQPAVIMPVSGDSSVMLEARSNSLVMIDPQGTFGRVFALPKTSDAANVALSTMYGGGGIDPNGRLVYFGRPDPIAIPNPGCAASKPKLTADSVSLLRANFETRQIDTIGRLRFSLLTGTLIASTTNPGCWEWQRKIDVLPYHGDQWARPLPPNAPAGFRFPPPPPVLTAAEIPDYYPPTRLGSMKVDFDGNLWIPPTTSRDARGGILYDVVNRKGEVIERVQFPAGRSVAAFVPGGKVVLRTREGNRITLELANVR